MSVSGISSTTDVTQTDWQSTLSQRQQYFNVLSQALQSGNLTEAQSAYSSLEQLGPTSSQSSTSTSSSNGTSTSSLGSDFSALGKALQSGDLAGAQKAFAQVQQDMKTTGAGHHHHHHHQSQAAASSTTTQDTSGTTSSTSTSGNSVNLFA
jgi:hypothetical protein